MSSLVGPKSFIITSTLLFFLLPSSSSCRTHARGAIESISLLESWRRSQLLRQMPSGTHIIGIRPPSARTPKLSMSDVIRKATWSRPHCSPLLTCLRHDTRFRGGASRRLVYSTAVALQLHHTMSLPVWGRSKDAWGQGLKNLPIRNLHFAKGSRLFTTADSLDGRRPSDHRHAGNSSDAAPFQVDRVPVLDVHERKIGQNLRVPPSSG